MNGKYELVNIFIISSSLTCFLIERNWQLVVFEVNQLDLMEVEVEIRKNAVVLDNKS